MKIARYGFFAAIGVATADAGISIAHWQFWMIMVCAALACECRAVECERKP